MRLALRASIATVALPCVLTGCFDNMYPTPKSLDELGDCDDGGEEPGFSGICQTDNELLRVFIATPALQQFEDATASIHGVLTSQFEPTDLTIQWDDEPVYTGEAETDIIYEWKDGPPDELGVTWCDDAKNDVECDQHYVRFNRSFTPTGRVICHESGHAVGLLHGDMSDPVMPDDDPSLGCMETPADGLDSILGEHNVSMINDTYPQPDDVPGLSHE